MSDSSVSKVPLTKVTLYKHGIGYFERRGKVEGPGSVELQCGPEDIDDMLKSLLVLKKGGGKISAVTYESSKPLEERLSEFGFDLKSSQSLVDLIGQLKGTPVSVKLGGKDLEGRVVGLDSVKRMLNQTIVEERFLLVFNNENVLLRLDVGAISGIEVKDEALAREVQQQLELLFLAVKKKDRKILKVDINNEGEHDLTIAYSIPCPIWKTSYRLLFDPEERLLIQGVAIVDNVQEEDWTEVKMVLVSSAPVSFIQPLYEPIKPIRRTIQGQGVRSSGPFVAERAQRISPQPPAAPGGAGDSLARSRGLAKMAMSVPAAAYGATFDMETGAQMQMEELSLAEGFADYMEEGIDVETDEKGELFEYKIGSPVTVPRNSSALIPVVQEYIEGERLSLFNESRNNEFPYATVKLKNTTGLTLEAGPVTVMEDDSYAGECLLDVLKPDDKRFLPYALDQSVRVVVRQNYERKPIWRVQVFDSMLYLFRKEISRKTYHIENLSDKKKIVYVEHPVNEGWQLETEEKPEETTKSFYRFRVELDGKKDHSLQVDEEKQVRDQFHLVGLDPNSHQIRWLFEQNYSDPKFLEFMKEVQKRRNEIIELGAEISTLNQRVREHMQEQERARENVKTLGSSGERFKQAIEQAEDKIISTQQKMQELNEQARKKTDDLNRYVYTRMEAEVVPNKRS